MRALDFDTMDNLKSKYGTNTTVEDFPDPSATEPSVVFKQKDQKVQFVLYDLNKAIPLLTKKGNMQLFINSSDLLDPAGISGRTKLVIKPQKSSIF